MTDNSNSFAPSVRISNRPQSILEGGTFGGILPKRFLISLICNGLYCDMSLSRDLATQNASKAQPSFVLSILTIRFRNRHSARKCDSVEGRDEPRPE